MRGLSRAQLINVSMPGTAGARSLADFIAMAGRMSWQGYLRSAALDTWVILFRFAIFAAFLTSAVLWLFVSQLTSTARLLFVGACFAVPASPVVAAIATDRRVRVSLARIRAGRCSVCGYVLVRDEENVAADAAAATVRCPECGKRVVAAAPAVGGDAADVEAETREYSVGGTGRG